MTRGLLKISICSAAGAWQSLSRQTQGSRSEDPPAPAVAIICAGQTWSTEDLSGFYFQVRSFFFSLSSLVTARAVWLERVEGSLAPAPPLCSSPGLCPAPAPLQRPHPPPPPSTLLRSDPGPLHSQKAHLCPFSHLLLLDSPCP